jgi:ABC-type antimicrobial peptide transport system permease subunit
MIRHYITIASRNFIKYKLQTLISVIGLAIGLVCFTYGMKWLEYETSYDGFYPKSKQMYTLYGINKQTGKKERKLPLVLARKLKLDFPEIKETALVYGNFGSTFKYNDQILEDPEEIFIDNNFFTLFPRKVLSGRQTNLLHSLDEIVITRSFALKYFKSPEDAIGKIMKNSYRETLTIVAVVEDAPANSAFKQDVFELDKFTTEMTDRISEDRQWSQFENEIYLLLEDKASADVFRKKLQTYLEKNNYLNTLTVKMIPLTDMRHTFGSELSFNLSYIRTFAITTILLLLCVFFNFINLLLNRIYQRIKEIRLRNSIGAGKRELIIQLLTELTLQTGIAFVLAFCLLELTSSLFCKTFDTKIADPDFYTVRERALDEKFPWDFIDAGVSREFLEREWLLALKGQVSPNCRQKCSGCGARRFQGGVCYEDQD